MGIIERTVQTHHVKIGVAETQGRGTPIVMLHGNSCSKRAFGKQLAGELGERHRLVALDLPGHGASDDVAEADADAVYSMPGYARAIGEALDALALGPCVLFGWSLGGHIAIELLAGRTDLLGIAVSGTPPMRPGIVDALRGFRFGWTTLLTIKRTFSEEDARRYATACFGGEPDAAIVADVLRSDGRARQGLGRSTRRREGVDQHEVVTHAQVPVAIMNGEHDALVRTSFFHKLSFDALWEGRCHVIEGAGHAPFWDRQEVFDAMLLRFVGGLDPARTGAR